MREDIERGRGAVSRHGEGIAYLAEAAWNLREWVRESAADRTLRPVLDSLLPAVRAQLEINLIDHGLSGVAAQLPAADGLSAVKLIEFAEGVELPGGLRLRIPQGKPPIAWSSLARARASRIALQVVGEDGKCLFDVENDSDLEKIEAMPAEKLAAIWDACAAEPAPAAEASAGEPTGEAAEPAKGEADLLLSVPDLVARLSGLRAMKDGQRRQWFQRFRRNHPVDFEQLENAPANQSPFLYRLLAVKAALKADE